MDVELPALAVIHLLVIHPVEPKWLHRVDLVVEVVAEQLQAAGRAVVQKLLRAVQLPVAVQLQAAEQKALAVHRNDHSFRLSEPGLAA